MAEKKDASGLEPIAETEDGETPREGGEEGQEGGGGDKAPGTDTMKSDASNPFEIQMSEFKEDRHIINVHQFYPSLEHQFSKSNTKFAEEQSVRTEEAIKELVEESSTFNLSEKGDGNNLFTDVTETDETSTITQTSSMQLVRKDVDSAEKSTPGTDDNNSSIDQKPGEVFSTAVDEETLEKAKKRRSIFQTEEWGAIKQYSPGMQEIIDKKAQEHMDKAMEFKAKGDLEKAISKVNKALALRTDPIYFRERAEIFIEMCDFSSAILNYKKACLLEPENAEYYNRLGFLYFFHGQTLFDQRLYPEALESFTRAAEMNPENTGFHIRSMTCLAALQRHGECLALVNKRLETDNQNPDLYIMRARLHEMFRNTTLCYYDIKDALQLDSEHEEGKVMMEKMEKRAQDSKFTAMQLILMGKHREALQKISVAIETNPAIADFHVLRGSLHRRLGDYNAAIDDFLLALDKCDHNEESPVYIDAQRQLLLTYNDFAVECFTKGFYEEAIILLNKAIKGEKREKGLYVNRGDCFFRQSDMNFALQDYSQALEIDPNDQSIKSRISVIHNEHGVNAYQEKNYAEAEEKMTLAIQYNPKVGQYYITRSRARYMLENVHGARMDLIIGLLLDPQNEDVISILSRLFPGKSIGDVINSRAAETAKIALRGILNIPSKTDDMSSKSRITHDALSDSGIVDTMSQVTVPRSAATTVWSQADSDISNVSDLLLKPGQGFPPLRSCMQEWEFNVKLAVEKKHVKDEIQSALKERKSLRYGGPRVQPLPPPSVKPTYGGASFRKEKMKPASDLPKKKGSGITYSWKQFSQGIGLVEGIDV
ncbi:hypothetical protein FSP39_022127 [Pinctada imbricata]|uniref:Tetratricopeptide repeat protein 16 n=1 Tax=Pinctada imbricata TaxID=66713 RepID=A0AA88Y3L3_PINIB|nr:hypothetical protein FSP39_022127 [Pinctada imbricata]